MGYSILRHAETEDAASSRSAHTWFRTSAKEIPGLSLGEERLLPKSRARRGLVFDESGGKRKFAANARNLAALTKADIPLATPEAVDHGLNSLVCSVAGRV